ncbi:MAG: hypothetical protein D6800_12645, partial [Candidatus Zixiibacteriota bacterium]
HYVILPSTQLWDVGEYMATFGGERCPEGFSYSSGTNDAWLSVEDLRALIKQHVDPTFSVKQTSPDSPTRAIDMATAREFYEAAMASV